MQEMTGALTPAVQIKCAVEEGMENIARAIFGENIRFITTYELSKLVAGGVGMVHAKASAVTPSGRTLTIKADMPIRYPDAACGGYRVDEVPFEVEANDWAEGMKFGAWCENSPSLGAKVIVREVYADNRERFLVADSMEGEVLHRGPFESLFPWAKQVVAEKWPHLPHVCIDTEKRAVMMLLVLATQEG